MKRNCFWNGYTIPNEIKCQGAPSWNKNNIVRFVKLVMMPLHHTWFRSIKKYVHTCTMLLKKRTQSRSEKLMWNYTNKLILDRVHCSINTGCNSTVALLKKLARKKWLSQEKTTTIPMTPICMRAGVCTFKQCALFFVPLFHRHLQHIFCHFSCVG